MSSLSPEQINNFFNQYDTGFPGIDFAVTRSNPDIDDIVDRGRAVLRYFMISHNPITDSQLTDVQTAAK